jgi:uncharacterized protein DUF4276
VIVARRPRRPGVKPTIGLVVEGDAEYAALPLLHRRNLFPGCPPMSAINLHGVGSDRLPIGIAKLVAPKVIQHQVAGREHVVVCIDREQRGACAPKLAEDVARELARELSARGLGVERVDIVVADRAFEAWLLADAAGLHRRGIFKTGPDFHCFEGHLGRAGKKGVVELGRLLGRPYDKTVDGPGLFAKVSFADARACGKGARGSKSLDKLLRSIGL